MAAHMVCPFNAQTTPASHPMSTLANIFNGFRPIRKAYASGTHGPRRHGTIRGGGNIMTGILSVYNADDHYGDEGYEAAVEDLMERAAETRSDHHADLTMVLNEYGGQGIEERMRERDMIALEATDMMLRHLLDGRTLLVRGTVGRWDGFHNGWETFDGWRNLMGTVFEDCTIRSIDLTEDGLVVDGAHHDGTTTVTVRMLTDTGETIMGMVDAARDWGEPFTVDGITCDGSREDISRVIRHVWESSECSQPPVIDVDMLGEWGL